MLARLSLLLALAAAARAGETRSLAELLPPGTPIYFETRQPTAAEQEKLAIYRCFQEPGLKEVVARISGTENSFSSMVTTLGPARVVLNTDLTSASLAMRVIYSDVKGERRLQVSSQFAIAVVGMADGPIPVDCVGAVQVDSGPEETLDVLKRIGAAASLAAKKQPMGDVDAEMAILFHESSHHDVPYTSVVIGPVKIYAAAVGGLFVVANVEARLKDIIDRSFDPAQPSLARDPRQLAAIASCPGVGTATSVITLHIDRALEAAASRYGPYCDIARNTMAGMGLDTLKTLVLASRADGSGTTSTFSLLFDGERKGVAKIFDPVPPGKFTGLEFAPKETFYVTAGRFNPGELLKMAREVYAIPVAMAEARVRQMFNVELGADLLDLIGPEGSLIISPNRGLIPDIGLVFDTRDGARLLGTMRRVLDALPWPEGAGLVARKFGDQEIFILPLGHPDLGGIPVAPTFGLVDGQLLITPFPLTFQRFLGVKRNTRPSLKENRDWAQLRVRVPADAVSVSYLDVSRLIAFYYDTMMPILQAFPGPGGGNNLYELPDVELFAKYLYGRVGWRTVDATGVHWCSHGSIDTSSLVLGAVGAIGGLTAVGIGSRGGPFPQPVSEPMVPEAARPARDREAATCMSHVRVIRARLKLHEGANGAYPLALADLAASHIPSDTFTVPGTDKPYVYFGAAGQGKLVLHGYVNGADGAITVLTRDLQIRRVTPAELPELLK